MTPTPNPTSSETPAADPYPHAWDTTEPSGRLRCNYFQQDFFGGPIWNVYASGKRLKSFDSLEDLKEAWPNTSRLSLAELQLFHAGYPDALKASLPAEPTPIADAVKLADTDAALHSWVRNFLHDEYVHSWSAVRHGQEVADPIAVICKAVSCHGAMLREQLTERDALLDLAEKQKQMIHAVKDQLHDRIDELSDSLKSFTDLATAQGYKETPGVPAAVYLDGLIEGQRERIAERDARFEQHTKAVAEFLRELYSIMVDPLADEVIRVDKMMIELKAAALKSREAANEAQGLRLIPSGPPCPYCKLACDDLTAFFSFQGYLYVWVAGTGLVDTKYDAPKIQDDTIIQPLTLVAAPAPVDPDAKPAPITERQANNLLHIIDTQTKFSAMTNQQLTQECLAHGAADYLVVTEMMNRLDPGWEDRDSHGNRVEPKSAIEQAAEKVVCDTRHKPWIDPSLNIGEQQNSVGEPAPTTPRTDPVGRPTGTPEVGFDASAAPVVVRDDGDQLNSYLCNHCGGIVPSGKACERCGVSTEPPQPSPPERRVADAGTESPEGEGWPKRIQHKDNLWAYHIEWNEDGSVYFVWDNGTREKSERVVPKDIRAMLEKGAWKQIPDPRPQSGTNESTGTGTGNTMYERAKAFLNEQRKSWSFIPNYRNVLRELLCDFARAELQLAERGLVKSLTSIRSLMQKQIDDCCRDEARRKFCESYGCSTLLSYVEKIDAALSAYQKSKTGKVGG